MPQHPQTTPWPPTRLRGSIFGTTLAYWCIPTGKERSDLEYHSQEILPVIFTILNQLPRIKAGTQYLLNGGNWSGFSFCDVEMKIKMRERYFCLYIYVSIFHFFKRIEAIYNKIIDIVSQVLVRSQVAKGEWEPFPSIHQCGRLVKIQFLLH